MFISYGFLLFFVLFTVLYYAVPKKCQWCLLLVADFAFYAAADIRYPLFLFVTSLTVWGTAYRIGHYNQIDADYRRGKDGEVPSRQERKAFRRRIGKKKKRVMLVCLFLNLGILAAVKYTNFVIDNVNTVLERTGGEGLSYVDFIVPLGISFYTFQAVGYLLDVYWDKCGIQKNFFRFTLFVSFFPQLVQGPISRYSHLSQTLYEKHFFDWQKVRFGLERILYGYFKKLVIADRVSAGLSVLADDPGYYSGGFVFVGMMLYAVQLYADFTGGIDITIGIAEVLGIRLEENFIRPYFSKSIAEYWRRWHVSMGTWFRDYMFYPCSISRPVKGIALFCKRHFGMGVARRVSVWLATVIVWLATGIWHGARQSIHMFTQPGRHPVTGGELTGLGLSWTDYGILGAGVLVMFLVSMSGRSGSVREKIAEKPYVVRYAAFATLFFAVLLLGVYGQGYDVRQFIYNQF